jgi:hypothetical protein
VNYSKGICWIDDCRIPFVDEKDPSAERYKTKNSNSLLKNNYGFKVLEPNNNYKSQGRFPANLLVSDDMLNDGSVSKSVKSKRGGVVDSNSGTYCWNTGKTEKVENYMCGVDDKGTNSRYYDIDKWFDNLLENYIY